MGCSRRTPAVHPAMRAESRKGEDMTATFGLLDRLHHVDLEQCFNGEHDERQRRVEQVWGGSGARPAVGECGNGGC